MHKLPKAFVIGPNTMSGWTSQGHYGEFAVPDYVHPELARCTSPAKVTMWFRSWEEAQEFIKIIKENEDGFSETNSYNT